MKKLYIFASSLILTLFASCDKENIVFNDFKDITFEEWPRTDCSTSTRPVRDLVAYNLLGIPYKWQEDWMGSPTYIIMPEYWNSDIKITSKEYIEKNLCSGTHGAYVNLINGETDVIIASRDISRNEQQLASEKGITLKTAPLATDALVFIVSPMNPVKNLTIEQVQKIYTGEITNWKEVGGEDHTITPYIRDADSGSQEKMETMVMKGLSMIDGKNMPEIIGSQMASPYWQIEHDEYGIGYTPFFYCTAMVRDLLKVDMLSINGVMPSKETLRNGSYPFISSIYAAKRESEEPNSKAYKFYDFLFTKSGANMIDESGYIAIR